MRGRRKVRTGVVGSDKMQKTVTVTLTRRFAHGFYGKQIVRTKQVAAPNDTDPKQDEAVRTVAALPRPQRKRRRRGDVKGGWRGKSIVGAGGGGVPGKGFMKIGSLAPEVI